jgi:hemoglobin
MPTNNAALTDWPIDPDSVYARIGGAPAVRRLVNRFYELMDGLPEAYTVRQIHPESLAGSAESLFEFHSGWFGGPPLYSNKKGHPRLRMRHAPYAVGPVERDEWMLCMRQALTEQITDPALRDGLIRTFADMADHMRNTDGRQSCGASGHANPDDRNAA